MTNRWNLPVLGHGIGLRTKHYGEILGAWPEVDFFEAITENYLDTYGRPLEILDEISSRYPFVLHGVSLNIGSTDPLDHGYLAKVRTLADRIGARWVSDHLCWTGVLGRNVHDLLPMPLSPEALRHVASRVVEVQDVLGRPLFLENPSTYLEFESSSIPEEEFLSELTVRTGCGLLVDVNNVYVSSWNHGWDAERYLDTLPADRIAQVHLAGHTDKGTHLLDTHSDVAKDEVLALYERLVARTGPVTTLFEWDEDIPPLATVLHEADRARDAAARALRGSGPEREASRAA